VNFVAFIKSAELIPMAHRGWCDWLRDLCADEFGTLNLLANSLGGRLDARRRSWIHRSPVVLRSEDVETAFEVVGDGKETDLSGGASETSLSHST
jgi:hypothetical protein